MKIITKLLLLTFFILFVKSLAQFVPPPPPRDTGREVSKDFKPNKTEYYSKYSSAPFLKSSDPNWSGYDLDRLVFNKVAKTSCNDGKKHTIDDRTFVIMHINRKGKVKKIEIPEKSIEDKCRFGIVDAVKNLKFVPATINGEKINVIYEKNCQDKTQSFFILKPKIMTWNPDVYDKFKKERAQPYFDLVNLTEKKSGISIIDLGCGTGELTATLQQNFENSQILGVDSSAEMLEKAGNFQNSRLKFIQRSIEDQVQQDEKYDLIISNAAIQWCSNHPELFPKMISKINSGGQLAVQMPSNHKFIVHQLLNKIAEKEPFKSVYNGWKRAYSVLNTEDYAKILLDQNGTDVNVFEKVYPHVMENAEAVYNWASGTAMIPYIEKLPEDLKENFKQEYLKELKAIFPGCPVFYPFKRTFIYAKF